MPVALDMSGKEPKSKPHYGKPTDPRFCPMKEVVDSYYFDRLQEREALKTLRDDIEAVLQRCFGKGTP